MLANVLVALAMALFLNFKKPIIAGAYFLVDIAQIILVLALIGILATVHLCLLSFTCTEKEGRAI